MSSTRLAIDALRVTTEMTELLDFADLPEGFEYPREFIRVVELGLIDSLCQGGANRSARDETGRTPADLLAQNKDVFTSAELVGLAHSYFPQRGI
jgi:hypothetical protein